jgi:CPA2 family monovalent cation:H+ antiporter-2
MEINILINILIVISSTVAVVYISNLLKIPHLVGYLLAGVLLSNNSFNIIQNPKEIESYAEIGVILLMFTIGLEFSFGNLKKIQKYVLLGGTSQVLLTITISTILIFIIGRSFPESIFWGFVISLSSTAIVIKFLQDKILINSPHGKVILAILLFQDIIIVPLMLLTPILAGQNGEPLTEIGFLILKLVALAAFAFIISKFIIPFVYKKVMSLQSQEIFLLATMAIVLAITVFTHELGLSLALGAFISGLIIAETDYNKIAIQCFLPFRYLFVSFFFISMGMLLDYKVFFDHKLVVLFWFAFILVVKFCSGYLAAKILKVEKTTAFSVGLGLAQIGEFSFILAKKGLDVRLITETNYQIFLAVSILTMLLTPILLNNMEILSLKLSKIYGKG